MWHTSAQPPVPDQVVDEAQKLKSQLLQDVNRMVGTTFRHNVQRLHEGVDMYWETVDVGNADRAS